MFQVSNASLQYRTIGIIKKVNIDFNLVTWFSSELGENVIIRSISLQVAQSFKFDLNYLAV
jgi:hypothetical protein